MIQIRVITFQYNMTPCCHLSNRKETYAVEMLGARGMKIAANTIAAITTNTQVPRIQRPTHIRHPLFT